MSRRVVLDASAALHVVLPTDSTHTLVDYLNDTTVVLAPTLFFTEVANALWKYVRAGSLEIDEAFRCYQEAVDLVSHFEPDYELSVQALAEAVRHDHPVYDCVYAVLARNHGCEVLTKDHRFRELLRPMGIQFPEL